LIANLDFASARSNRRNLVADQGKDSEAQQKVMNVLDQATGVGVILEEYSALAGVDTTIATEEGLQEKPDRLLWRLEDRLRHEFLARTDVQAIALQPDMCAVCLGDSAPTRAIDQAISVIALKRDLSEAGFGHGPIKQCDERGVSGGIGGAMSWSVTLTFRNHET